MYSNEDTGLQQTQDGRRGWSGAAGGGEVVGGGQKGGDAWRVLLEVLLDGGDWGLAVGGGEDGARARLKAAMRAGARRLTAHLLEP